MVLAGANAVSVGTTIFNDPSAPMRIQNELEHELRSRGFAKFSQAVSYAHREVDYTLQTDTPIVDLDRTGEDWDFISE